MIVDDPEGWAVPIYKTRKMLRDGEYPQWLVNAVLQKYGEYQNVFNVADAYVFRTIYNLHILGEILISVIKIGEQPCSNNMIEENNSSLCKLPSYFKSKFIPAAGGSANDDGYFKWEIPIDFVQLINNEVDNIYVPVPPMSIPLEVGFTDSYTTLFHLIHHGGVARWPYYSDEIILFVTTQKFVERYSLINAISKTKQGIKL